MGPRLGLRVWAGPGILRVLGLFRVLVVRPGLWVLVVGLVGWVRVLRLVPG